MDFLGTIILLLILYFFIKKQSGSKKQNPRQIDQWDKIHKSLKKMTDALDDGIASRSTPYLKKKNPEQKAIKISQPYVPRLKLKNYNNIFCLGTYIPYSRKSEIQDAFSKDILKLKDMNQYAIYKFSKELDCVVPSDVSLCMVPSSNPMNTTTGISKIIEELSIKNNRINASNCLIRTIPITPLKYGGNRNVQVHLDSISCINQYEIKDKYIVLLDDVCTTGNSLKACVRILKSNGAKAVMCMAIAKTKPIS